MRWFILVFFLIVCSSGVLGLENSMTLLAVQETSEGLEGGTAELSLEVKEGKGRVFVETSPLTKVDTQVSTKMAKEIACDFLDVSCNSVDFVYTIKSSSPIIGGPSAGSAMAVLTVVTLEKMDYDEDVTITGTINSGGVVGAVGGVGEKVKAAKEAGLDKVLIPFGESISRGNESVNLSEIEGIDFKRVSTLGEALKEFTGEDLGEEVNGSVEIDKEYDEIMKNVSNKLCGRTRSLIEKVNNSDVDYNESLLNGFVNSSEKAKGWYEEKRYYSAASKCFSTNINLRKVLNRNLSEEDIEKGIENLREEIEDFNEEVDERKIETMPGLQSKMIVKERIYDAKNNLEEASEVNGTNKSKNLLSYAQERLLSARTWSFFFDMEGKKTNFEDEVLRNSCESKLKEANDRFQYVSTFFPQLGDIKDQLMKAREKREEGENALCLYFSSLAKARTDAIITSIGLRGEGIKELINLKLDIAKNNIIEQQMKGRFPISGYAYYEYSESLINESTSSSLLFSQYALELSNLDVYLKNDEELAFVEGNETGSKELNQKDGFEMLMIYTFGVITGVVVTFLIFFRRF